MIVADGQLTSRLYRIPQATRWWSVDRNLRDIPFFKMTGSGNDFVFFDGRIAPGSVLSRPEVIRAICNRHNGIGADGIVILEPAFTATVEGREAARSERGDAQIHYFNSDGTPADLCGNATLCSTVLSVLLNFGHAEGLELSTPSGLIAARLHDGLPEITLPPIEAVADAVAIDLDIGESRIGFAIVGIPHLVVLCEDADAVAVETRGPLLRWHAEAGPTGANVNWVSPRPDGTWRYRTFERGVEGETLACGTGAVATATLLNRWGFSGTESRILTSSGRTLEVVLRAAESGLVPSLRGEGRVVFTGTIGDLVA